MASDRDAHGYRTYASSRGVDGCARIRGEQPPCLHCWGHTKRLKCRLHASLLALSGRGDILERLPLQHTEQARCVSFQCLVELARQ